MAENNGKEGLVAILADRRRRFAGNSPAIRWKTWLALTLLMVATAMLWRDAALTIAARSEPYWLHHLAESTTNFGKSGWILVSSAVVFAVGLAVYRRADLESVRRKGYDWAVAAAYMFLSVALSGIISNLVKRAIGRARPPLFDQFGPFHFQPFSGALYESLPSGHATTDGAIAMALAVLVPAYRTPILIIGALFALTRIAVGAHYLSDVIAGYSFGMWYAYMSAIVFLRHGFPLRSITKL